MQVGRFPSSLLTVVYFGARGLMSGNWAGPDANIGEAEGGSGKDGELAGCALFRFQQMFRGCSRTGEHKAGVAGTIYSVCTLVTGRWIKVVSTGRWPKHDSPVKFGRGDENNAPV